MEQSERGKDIQDKAVLVVALETVRFLEVNAAKEVLELGKHRSEQVCGDEVSTGTDSGDSNIAPEGELPAVLTGDLDSRTGKRVEEGVDDVEEGLGGRLPLQRGEKLLAKLYGVGGEGE